MDAAEAIRRTQKALAYADDRARWNARCIEYNMKKLSTAMSLSADNGQWRARIPLEFFADGDSKWNTIEGVMVSHPVSGDEEKLIASQLEERLKQDKNFKSVKVSGKWRTSLQINFDWSIEVAWGPPPASEEGKAEEGAGAAKKE